jgi:hypothetical protein
MPRRRLPDDRNLPTSAQIEAVTAAIRATWSPRRRRKRLGSGQPVVVPEVRIAPIRRDPHRMID